ncbi:MAG: hypothetical protein ACX98W_01795 [bacterium]
MPKPSLSRPLPLALCPGLPASAWRATGMKLSPPGSPPASSLGLPLLLSLLLLQAACVFPPPYREVPSYPVRFADIETVTLIPPQVTISAVSSGDVALEVQEWTDAAYENAKAAVQARVEGMGKRFVPFAGSRGPRPDLRVDGGDVNARVELTPAGESWLLFESAREAILRHTYDPTQVFPDRMKNFDYTLGEEARSMLAGTPADAFLLMIARDSVPTTDRQALVGVGAAAALYTGSYGGPGTTPAELTVALVESRSGEILWFNHVSMPLTDLRDPASSAKLVDLVLKGMSR